MLGADTASANPVLAADVGGTHIRAAVVEDGSIVERLETPTPHDQSRPTAVFDLMQRVLERHAVKHAVVGLPGRVNYAEMTLEYAPNLPPTWADELRADVFRERLGIDVLLAIDADLAAVGEAAFGAGSAFDDIVYITVSTGVGAGVVLGGRLVAGTRSVAEIGHIVIDRVAARTAEPATVEQLGSGTALRRDAESVGLAAHDAALLRMIEAHDPWLARAWQDVREAVGYAAVAMAQLFTPQVIVVGGGLGRASSALLEAVRQFLDASGPRGLPRQIAVRSSSLKDDAGLLGAPAWQDPVQRRRPEPAVSAARPVR